MFTFSSNYLTFPIIQKNDLIVARKCALETLYVSYKKIQLLKIDMQQDCDTWALDTCSLYAVRVKGSFLLSLPPKPHWTFRKIRISSKVFIMVSALFAGNQSDGMTKIKLALLCEKQAFTSNLLLQSLHSSYYHPLCTGTLFCVPLPSYR